MPILSTDVGFINVARDTTMKSSTTRRQRFRTIAQKLALLFGSFFLCFFIIEMYYRVLDPFPFFSNDEVNQVEHGNLSTYDRTLGWKGVPGGKAEFVTRNNRVWLEHNADGFRDIKHEGSDDKRPAIVFLGDSFTWGYEVEFDEMFVNQLRDRLPSYEIFNLAHRGYGTDQELLAFKRWHDKRPLDRVVLMFSSNDVADNSARVRYHKRKPRYQLFGDRLVLTGVPVPRDEDWTHSPGAKIVPTSWRTKLNTIPLRSHFLHYLCFRFGLFEPSNKGNRTRKDGVEPDIRLTSRILEELKMEVERRNAKLVVVFIPSKREIERMGRARPYQVEMADLCKERGIECFDLAPDFKATRRRTYYRYGFHWNSRGHRVAAEAIHRHLTRDADP